MKNLLSELKIKFKWLGYLCLVKPWRQLSEETDPKLPTFAIFDSKIPNRLVLYPPSYSGEQFLHIDRWSKKYMTTVCVDSSYLNKYPILNWVSDNIIGIYGIKAKSLPMMYGVFWVDDYPLTNGKYSDFCFQDEEEALMFTLRFSDIISDT